MRCTQCVVDVKCNSFIAMSPSVVCTAVLSLLLLWGTMEGFYFILFFYLKIPQTQENRDRGKVLVDDGILKPCESSTKERVKEPMRLSQEFKFLL